jgi:hypothetical protein
MSFSSPIEVVQIEFGRLRLERTLSATLVTVALLCLKGRSRPTTPKPADFSLTTIN